MCLDFIKNFPKVELHAHLNGSLNTASILELGELLYGVNNDNFKNLARKFIEFDGLNLNDCFEKFNFMHQLTSTEKGLTLATQLVIRDFVMDHVIYLELRTTPKCKDSMTKSHYLKCVLKAIETSPDVISKKIIVKLLPSIDRSKPLKDAEEMLNIVLELLKDFPHYITGIDLSGNPNCGNFQDFQPLLTKAKESNLKLALHCAEIDNPAEIEEMIKFGMNRCGHGTFLNTNQIGQLVKQGIGIECCLTSNVKCSTVPSYNDHHFKVIFDHDEYNENSDSLVLCTDDCGVFNSTLSQELEIATKTFSIDKEGIKKLQLNAIRHAFANEIEKESLKEQINKYCEQFN